MVIFPSLVQRINLSDLMRPWRGPMHEAAGRTMSRRCRSVLSFLIVGFSLLAVGLRSVPAGAQNAVVLVGSGSSVPAPLYNRWTQEYAKHNSKIQMRYLTVGT